MWHKFDKDDRSTWPPESKEVIGMYEWTEVFRYGQYDEPELVKREEEIKISLSHDEYMNQDDLTYWMDIPELPED